MTAPLYSTTWRVRPRALSRSTPYTSHSSTPRPPLTPCARSLAALRSVGAWRSNKEDSEMTYDVEKFKDFNAVHLAAVLQHAKPEERAYVAARDATLIYRLARSTAALAVASCNYGLSARQETRRENIAKEISAIAAHYGLTASCYGDPRGYTVRLEGPGVVSTGWGDGFGVA